MWALSGAIADSGSVVCEMGANEAVEGLTRLAVAEAAVQRSEDLALSGIDLLSKGVDQMEQDATLVDAREASPDPLGSCYWLVARSPADSTILLR